MDQLRHWYCCRPCCSLYGSVYNVQQQGQLLRKHIDAQMMPRMGSIAEYVCFIYCYSIVLLQERSTVFAGGTCWLLGDVIHKHQHLVGMLL